MKIFSFDAETDGLWGKAFAVAAVTAEGQQIQETFMAYLGPDGVSDEWVQQNVLPQLEGSPVSHSTYEELLSNFAAVYLSHKENADIVVHVGSPVETRLVSDMHYHRLIGDFEAPFPLIDVSSILRMRGEDPISIDAYISKHNLVPGSSEISKLNTHPPLYDAAATAAAYAHLMDS